MLLAIDAMLQISINKVPCLLTKCEMGSNIIPTPTFPPFFVFVLNLHIIVVLLVQSTHHLSHESLPLLQELLNPPQPHFS